MQIASILTRALRGIEAPAVRVEAHLSSGIPAFAIVGMPETAVRESKERVRSAILNSHLAFPQQRITVNLAPADLRKDGERFDLPIALSILAASQQLRCTNLAEHEFIGELALDGQLRAVPGALCAATAAGGDKRAILVPAANAPHAAHAHTTAVFGAKSLLEVCAHLNGRAALARAEPAVNRSAMTHPDLAEIVGQAGAKRALEIAAAGGHHLLLNGPPGAGKTLLARCLPGLLPSPDEEELQAILAIAGLAPVTESHAERPFRAPHHSASAAALVGGGRQLQPGEITLAHGGVLFLDELPEFNRAALEALREPLENGCITLARASERLRLPARFQLIGAMNPCPCGQLGNPLQRCRCSPELIKRYQGRLSGPLLDRIDMLLTVERIDSALLLQKRPPAESSTAVRARCEAARGIAIARQGCSNANLSGAALLMHCQLSDDARRLLQQASQRLALSGRAVHRILRVARSIADLAAQCAVERSHIAEALALRQSPLRSDD
jgi:magnesium chelatase family protein